jgi:hypothetical protein
MSSRYCDNISSTDDVDDLLVGWLTMTTEALAASQEINEKPASANPFGVAHFTDRIYIMLIIFLSSSPSSFDSSLNRKCHVCNVLLNLMLVPISTAPLVPYYCYLLPLLNAKPREDKQDEASKGI